MMRNQGNNPDLEQLIKDAKCARMEFVQKIIDFLPVKRTFRAGQERTPSEIQLGLFASFVR